MKNTVAELLPGSTFRFNMGHKKSFFVKLVYPVPMTAPEHDHGKMIVAAFDDRGRCRQILLWPSTEIIILS